MKKIAPLSLALFASILLFNSCKKGTPSASYSMTATVGGTVKNFNFIPPVATVTNAGGTTFVSITGILSTATGESMMIELDNDFSGIPIKAGTYSDTSQTFNLDATYTVNIAEQFTAGSVIESEAAGFGIPLTNHFKLVINSLDSTAIKGTFSGDFFANSDPSAASKSITNGSFYAKFQR